MIKSGMFRGPKAASIFCWFLVLSLYYMLVEVQEQIAQSCCIAASEAFIVGSTAQVWKSSLLGLHWFSRMSLFCLEYHPSLHKYYQSYRELSRYSNLVRSIALELTSLEAADWPHRCVYEFLLVLMSVVSFVSRLTNVVKHWITYSLLLAFK